MFKDIREVKWFIIIVLLLVSPVFSYLQLFVLIQNETTLNIYRTISRATGGLLLPTLVYYLIMIFFVIFILFMCIGKLKLREIGVHSNKLKTGILFTFIFWCTTVFIAGISSVVATGSLSWNPIWAEKGFLVVIGILLGQLLGNALYEEIVFRGFLIPQSYLKVRGSREMLDKKKLIIALILSQIVFSLIHLPHRILHNVTGYMLFVNLVGVFLLGIIFALLYLRTKNLFIVIGLHSLMNCPTLLVKTPFQEESIPVLLSIIVLIFWPRISRWLKMTTGDGERNGVFLSP